MTRGAIESEPAETLREDSYITKAPARPRGVICAVPSSVLTIFLVILLILTYGCDEEARDRRRDYFNSLQRELDEYAKDTSSQAYRYRLIQEVPNEVRIDAMRLWLSDAPEPYANARDGLSRLLPPQDAADSHSAMVAGIDGMHKFIESLQRGADPATLIEEEALREAFSDPKFAVFGQRFRIACLDLQALAELSTPEIRLKCELP